MKILKHIIPLLSILFVGNLHAQVLVGSTFIETQTKEQIANDYGVDAIYDVDLFKVLYETLDITGALDTASGLLIVPNTVGDTYPMLCYQHGTVNGRTDVPSNLQGGAGLARNIK